jgi:hypothetical protein
VYVHAKCIVYYDDFVACYELIHDKGKSGAWFGVSVVLYGMAERHGCNISNSQTNRNVFVVDCHR